MNLLSFLKYIFSSCIIREKTVKKYESCDKYESYGCDCVKIITNEGNNILCRNKYCDMCVNNDNHNMWVPL
jgi:hypothetical protein